MRLHSALFAMCLLPLVGGAEGLVFTPAELELYPSILDEQVTGEFAFNNRGARTISITGVTTSCGCTTAQPDTSAIAPGASGRIPFTFVLGGRTGYQEKTIKVATDDPALPSIRLTLKVHIAEGALIAPTAVSWPTGSPVVTKSVTITLPAGSPMRLIEAKPNNPQLRVTMHPGEAPLSWIVAIIPVDTDHPLRGVIEITTNGERKLQVFAAIIPVAHGSPPAGQH